LTLCYQLDDRRKLVGDNSADEQRAALLPGQIGESLRKRARRDGKMADGSDLRLLR